MNISNHFWPQQADVSLASANQAVDHPLVSVHRGLIPELVRDFRPPHTWVVPLVSFFTSSSSNADTFLIRGGLKARLETHGTFHLRRSLGSDEGVSMVATRLRVPPGFYERPIIFFILPPFLAFMKMFNLPSLFHRHSYKPPGVFTGLKMSRVLRFLPVTWFRRKLS